MRSIYALMSCVEDADIVPDIVQTDDVCDAERMMSIEWANAICPLVELLNVCGSDGVNAAAASALMRLSCDSQNKVDITRAGAVAPLVLLLGGSGGCRLKAAAAWALYTLDTDEDMVAIAEAGGIVFLVALLGKYGCDCEKEAAACVLLNLARYNDENKSAIVLLGGTDYVLDVLLCSFEDDGLKKAAACLLDVLTKGDAMAMNASVDSVC